LFEFEFEKEHFLSPLAYRLKSVFSDAPTGYGWFWPVKMKVELVR